MKKWILSLAALAALPVSTLYAQNITGNWQGTIEAGPQKLRVVFEITLQDDKPKAVFHSIDQPQAPAMAATSVTKDGSTVKITLAGVASYEGKLSADGNSMTGTWTQGAALPLNLVKATTETAWAIPEPPPPPKPMDPKSDPEFAVATIKPSDPARPGKLFTVRGQDVVTINTTLADLITMAFDLHPKQLSGGPSWMESDKYDVTGRPSVPGQPSVAQLKIMMQKMVKDRFQLKFHNEKKELPVYTINVLKSGAKLAASQAAPGSLPGLFFGGAGPAGGVAFNVRNATLAEVAQTIQTSVLDKPVVDQTGLTGKYDFTLKFTPDASQMTGFGQRPPATADNPDAPPDLFTAIQQQLGLKLESTKAPVEVMVIDHVEKPSAN